MSHYRPRWYAHLDVPGIGTSASRKEQEQNTRTYRVPLKVASATLSLNHHNQADELELVVDWKNIGLTPRLVRNAEVQFHVSSTDETETWEPTVTGGRTGQGNCRFIGTVLDCSRRMSEEDGDKFTLRALDYTDFFLRAKPFGSSGIPDYSQRLDDAWRRIVSQTPGAERLADRIELRGISEFPTLGDAVSERLKGKGQVHVHRNTDAWAVWQQCVGSLGLISFFELDRLIVTNAEGYYRTSDAPVLRYGENVEELEEVRDGTGFATGVGISSFDPLSGRVIEAVWPPYTEKASKEKKVRARKQLTKDPDGALVQRYDWFAYPGITSTAAALSVAKRAYAERSKQEFQGTALTREMVVKTVNGAEFDLLDLRIGDNVWVGTNDNPFDALLSLLTPDERVRYLISQGIDASAAQLMADAAQELAQLDQTFYVRGFKVDMETSHDAGSFSIEVNYCNRILVDGEAQAEPG